MLNSKFLKTGLFSLFLSLGLEERAFAWEPYRNLPVLNPLAEGRVTFVTIVENILGIVLWAAGILAFGYLVYGGIIYITSAGNEDKAKQGKSAIISAVIGIVIVLLSLVIMGWARRFLESSGGEF